MKPSVITQINPTKILNWLKNQLPTSTFNDIKTLLKPCCVPSVTFGTMACVGNGDGVNGLEFQNITISDPTLLGQTVKVIITSSTYTPTSGGGIALVELDGTGSWTGNIFTSFTGCSYGGNYSLTFTVSLIPSGSNVAHVSAPITITATNCC